MRPGSRKGGHVAPKRLVESRQIGMREWLVSAARSDSGDPAPKGYADHRHVATPGGCNQGPSPSEDSSKEATRGSACCDLHWLPLRAH
jgi:hypothetical protein